MGEVDGDGVGVEQEDVEGVVVEGSQGVMVDGFIERSSYFSPVSISDCKQAIDTG